MKLNFRIGLLILLIGILSVVANAGTADIFDSQNYPGTWTLVTNEDLTITATEAAIHRDGDKVYKRVLSLVAVAGEISPSNHVAASETEIRKFISGYQPPPIPYTSEETAEKTGRKKFNCLEFAEDLVTKANAAGIPAEVIGVAFQGQTTGHACAGFPTIDGRMLYFDSTPGAGQISHRAHEAQIQVGESYQREGGGELEGAGKLPITAILPVSPLAEIANSVLEKSSPYAATPKMTLVVEDKTQIQADGIDYAGPDTLQVSEAQLAKWNQAAAEIQTQHAQQQSAQKIALRNQADQAAANALEENKKQAASGDVYGQLRMGERYLNGDGVEKNLSMARTYLQLAANQGSPTAQQELNKLDAQTAGQN